MNSKFNKEDLDDVIAFLCEKVKNQKNPKKLDRTFELIKLLKNVEYICDTFDEDILSNGFFIGDTFIYKTD